MAVVPEITRINLFIARFADGRRIRDVNISDKLADREGKLFDGMTVDRLYPTMRGYQRWADAPEAAVDGDPPPASGDRPSAAANRRSEREEARALR